MLMPSIFGENLFDNFFGDFDRPMSRPFGFADNTVAVMKTDIREKEDGFELDIDLPGYKKDEVKASLKDGYMTITAENSRSDDEKDENGKYVRRERYYGSCSRSFYVGDAVKEEDIKAKFSNGILTIRVPKKEMRPEVDENKYIAIEG